MVLDIYDLHEWQCLAKDGTGVLPWFVRPALDVLEAMDLSDKNVYEWGGGKSSCWFAKHAKFVYTVESNEQWANDIRETLAHYKLGTNIVRHESDPDKYVEAFSRTGLNYHIIVVDGIERDRCMLKALECAREGTLIIADNWMQPSVEVASQEVQDEVMKYKHEVYKQEGHPDWKSLFLWK